jgi:hypothetical protein
MDPAFFVKSQTLHGLGRLDARLLQKSTLHTNHHRQHPDSNPAPILKKVYTEVQATPVVLVVWDKRRGTYCGM